MKNAATYEKKVKKLLASLGKGRPVSLPTDTDKTAVGIDAVLHPVGNVSNYDDLSDDDLSSQIKQLETRLGLGKTAVDEEEE